MHRLRCALLVLAISLPVRADAQRAFPRQVFLDSAGVIRWNDDRTEVALFGANYTLPSASDYRAAGHVGADRKRLIDQDMAHFARMGWNGLRLASWGDWESADTLGNLIANEHLDLLDYLIARARERGIYMLLTPIQTYDAGWPDALATSRGYPGFSRKYQRSELGTSAAAIRAQANYLRQFLDHVNPYTGVAIKDDPAIVFVEMINEPVHHPRDERAAVAYIDTLVAAVRSTGARQILFHNVSQDFAISRAIRRSKVQGISFGWYPTGLNAGRELRGNYLRTVDHYEPMRAPELRGLPRIVYEFDSADLRTGYMYPAMTRTMRGAGAQFVAMFAYDMLGTASRNLGWQTHYLNLVYTPRKAMSAVIAAEAMRRLPRDRSYGAYPANTRFGDFRVRYEEDLGELAAADAFLYTGTTRTVPPAPRQLRRVAGVGSSPVVTYDGEGVYFLDRVREGVWRLEVYPDAVPVRDPFEMPSPGKIVTRAIHRRWPMAVRLPDLGAAFTVQPIAASGAATARAERARFVVGPGVYVLSARGPVDRASLPATLDIAGTGLRFEEFHAPATDAAPVQVLLEAPREHVRGSALQIGATVADSTEPDSVSLYVRPVGSWFRRYPMERTGAYRYRASVPADSMPEGMYELAITVVRDGRAMTFPEGGSQRPWDWDFHGQTFWTTSVVGATTPLRLFAPGEDARRLAFTRIGDAGRTGIFRIVPSRATGQPAFRFALPVRENRVADDYTASLVVAERIAARREHAERASAVRVRLRGFAPGQRVHLTLVEDDGTGWSVAIPTDTGWTERTIPLAELGPAPVAKLPEGFPGKWNYAMPPAAGRGGTGDRIRPGRIERIQLSLRGLDAGAAHPDSFGVEVESVTLVFE